MTIQTSVRKARFIGNAVTTTFPFSFKTFSATDLVFTQTSIAGVDTLVVSNFSVVLNTDQEGSPGGVVTYPTSGSPLATGVVFTITTNESATQLTDLTNAGGFFPKTITDRFDYLTVLIQRALAGIAGALTVSVSDPAPNLAMGTATQRANKYVTFDSSGNVALATSLPSGTLSLSSITALTGAQTPAEVIAGVTPVNLQYPQGLVDRYKTNVSPGVTDMTTAINAAIAVASVGEASALGIEVIFGAGVYAFSSDIVMPMGDPYLNGGGIYAITVRGQGKEQTVLKAIAGGSFTHGLYFNGGANYKNMGTLRDLQIDGNGLLVDAITMSFCQMGNIDHVNVRHCIGRGLYVNNCLMCRARKMFVTTCSSNGSSQIEIDATLVGSTGGTTTFILDQCWSQGGAVGCTAALAIDRSNNVTILNGAYESSGFCFVISGKAATAGCFGVVFDNVDFESPGGSAYFAAGFGLSGGVLTNFGLRNCTGEGPGSISYVGIMQQTQGFFVEGAGTDFILGGSQSIVWNLFGTTNINARIDACPLMANAGSAVPWIDVNGAQIRSAGPLVRWEQGTQVAPYFMGQKAVSGATWSVWVDGANVNQGGYYRTLVASNGGATGIGALPGDAGMEINIIGDGFSTIPQGTSGNNFDNVSGANLLLLANHLYQYRYDGSRGCWRQLGTA